MASRHHDIERENKASWHEARAAASKASGLGRNVVVMDLNNQVETKL